MTVLVVNESKESAESVQALLEEQGHSCLIAKDIEEADWTLQMAKVDALAVAVDSSGAALAWLDTLCLAQPLLARRTLMVSDGYLDDDQVLRIRACGAGLLQRPASDGELRDAILARVRTEPSTERDTVRGADQPAPTLPPRKPEEEVEH